MAVRRALFVTLGAVLLHGGPVPADESAKRGEGPVDDAQRSSPSSERGTVGDYSDTGGTPGSPSDPARAQAGTQEPSEQGTGSGRTSRAAGQEAERAAQQRGGGQRGAERLLDVEELNDDVARYVGQRVSVAGEIQEWLDPRSFVLESGGILDDEIAVVVPRDAKGIDPSTLAEDADVVVSGTVRQATLVDIERELGWDLRPELEIEFDGTRTYLVADRITRQQDGDRAQTREPSLEGRGSGGEAAVGDFSDTGSTPGSPSEPRSEKSGR
jgi:hypothetical protein